MTFLTLRTRLLCCSAAAALTLIHAPGSASVSSASLAARPFVIAHRGASAYAPEHTAAAYRLAIEQGADYVEQDLGITRDGVLVCTHDAMLERTSNVREVFPDRFTEVKTGDRVERHWLVENFTLAEIRQLDAGAWFGPQFAGARMLTFDEAVEIVKGRAGFFPELKVPARFRARGFDPEALVADALRKHGLLGSTFNGRPAVHLQVFEEDSLRRLARLLPDVPRSFLIGSAEGTKRWLHPVGLAEVKTFATGIGPAYHILDRLPEVVGQAHAAGLTVVPYTFAVRPAKDPSPDAPADRRAAIAAAMRTLPATREALSTQIRLFLERHAVDGYFTDNPDVAPR